MFQRTFEAYTSTNPEHLAKNAQNLFNITYDIFSHKVSEKLVGDNNELASFSDDSVSTKDSEECNEECILKKSSISQKKSYKKAPQGKMDSRDEELLLTLASKYKHDWKKVSKKIFKLHKKKLGPNLLRIRYKELAPDLTQKRVRFTHTEDLLIVKLFSRFGYDWEKIASEFESRTSIMVKNRFYHIKKKNILQSLLNEVEANNALTGNNENIIEDAAQPEIVEQEIQQFQEVIPENGDDTLQYFVQRGDEIQSQKLRVFDDSHGFFEEQLWDKVTPMGDWDSRSTSNFMEEDNGYSLTSFMNFNPRYFYF